MVENSRFHFLKGNQVLLQAMLVVSVLMVVSVARIVLSRRARASKTVTLFASASLLLTLGVVSPASASTTLPQKPLKITNTAHKGYVGTSLKVSVSGGSGSGVIRFEVKGKHCMISTTSGLLRASAPTTCAVVATKAANPSYKMATSPVVHFVFATKVSLRISNTILKGQVGVPLTVKVSGGLGSGAVSFDTNGSVCSINPATGVLVAGAVGSCPVTATKAKSGKYPTVTSAPVKFVFGVGPQTKLVIANSSLLATVGTPITVATTGGSGSGLVTYSVTGSGCAVSAAGVLSDSAPGTCTVTASKAASSSYLATSSAAVTFTFNAAGAGGVDTGNDTPTPAAPDIATLTSVTGATAAPQLDLSTIGRTEFLNQYYNANDHWFIDYLTPGSTVTLTWHVLGSNGLPLAGANVTLDANLKYSCSNGVTWTPTTLNSGNINPGTYPNCDGQNQGADAGTTDANGNVSFTLVNTNVSGTTDTNTGTAAGVAAIENATTATTWTAMALQVGGDVFTASPNTTVNEQVDRVDFIVMP